MDYSHEAGGLPSVAPPGPATPVLSPPPDLAATDAAVRWRINAAILDNLIVTGLYLTLCALLHWRAAAVAHLAVLVVAGLAYHFVLEARDGQTLGKRCFGIRVVSADGSPVTTRSVAIRSVLRLIDQLPICYVSGLVSMVRTGPSRRQRIGDVAAQTVVVAVAGQALRRGTPRWMLPAVTIVAVLASAGLVYTIANVRNAPLTSTQRSEFVIGCERGAGRIVDCRCVLTQLEAAGYNTLNRLASLATQERAARAAGNPAGLPSVMTQAVNACRR